MSLYPYYKPGSIDLVRSVKNWRENLAAKTDLESSEWTPRNSIVVFGKIVSQPITAPGPHTLPMECLPLSTTAFTHSSPASLCLQPTLPHPFPPLSLTSSSLVSPPSPLPPPQSPCFYTLRVFFLQVGIAMGAGP